MNLQCSRQSRAFGTTFRITGRLSKQFLEVIGCFQKAGTNLPEYDFKKDFLNHKVLPSSKHELYIKFLPQKAAKNRENHQRSNKNIKVFGQ
jgi:hypothetical protein